MRLTGNEKWIAAGKAGEEIYAKSSSLWWPIVDVELDCGLIKIDVCGQTETLDFEMVEIKIGDDGEELEDVYEQIVTVKGDEDEKLSDKEIMKMSDEILEEYRPAFEALADKGKV